MRFRVLVSRHAQKELLYDDDGKVVTNEKGEPQKVQCVYGRGDIVESSIDLVARFNSPGSVKFERLPDERKRPAEVPAQPAKDKPAQPQQAQPQPQQTKK